MRGLWLFLHILGFAAWMGGGLAMMLAGITAKNFSPEERLAVYRTVSVVARNLVGTGALLVLVSGFVLSIPYFQATMPGWLMTMRGCARDWNRSARRGKNGSAAARSAR